MTDKSNNFTGARFTKVDTIGTFPIKNSWKRKLLTQSLVNLGPQMLFKAILIKDLTLQLMLFLEKLLTHT